MPNNNNNSNNKRRQVFLLDKFSTILFKIVTNYTNYLLQNRTKL